MFFITLIIFIVIFSALVLVHEWGHFYMARKAGIKVDEFGIGFPPRAKKIYTDKHGTVYSINWIPFGGYVRLHGEDSSDPEVLKEKNSFASKTKLQRTAVIVAGVFMNFVLAWLLLTIGYSVGMKPFLVSQEDVNAAVASGQATLQNQIYLTEVTDESPLKAVGIVEGDMITKINGQIPPEAEQFSSVLQPNESVEITYTHKDQEEVVTVQTNDEGKLGIGIADAPLVVQSTVRYPVHEAAYVSLKETGRLSYLTVKMLGNVVVSLVAKFKVPEGVSGPVGIFKMTEHFSAQGVIPLLQFAALLSISLGVINIMPFPALDGGRFLFIIFELILRKRPNAKWEAMIHGIGFILLIALILVVTWKDIMNLF